MKQVTIADLFDLPTFSACYLAAGSGGVHRRVDRIDILEHPFPEVEIYLEKNELIFTSFWNSKDSPERRIQLIKAMIQHDCAGIGIMPGLHLHNKIDDEIIELGNRYNFPVIVLGDDTRYSDIIREFYQNHTSEERPLGRLSTYELLCIVDDYKRDGNLLLLGNRLEQYWKLPVLLSRDGEGYSSSFSGRERALSKLEAVFAGKNYVQYAPVSLYINQQERMECIMGKNSFLATFFRAGAIPPELIALFRDTASFLCQIFDNAVSQHRASPIRVQLSSNDRFYFFYMRCSNILKVVDAKENDWILYDYNKNSNYAIGLYRQQDCVKQPIFEKISHLYTALHPQCLIFGENCFFQEQIGGLAQYVTAQTQSFYDLSGIFLLGELPIISLLNIAPLAVKGRINSFNAQYINMQESPVCLDTLRLFLVLRSINQVAQLLSVHVNTVKYRIRKAVNSTYFDLECSISDLCSLELLIPLETLKLEALEDDL